MVATGDVTNYYRIEGGNIATFGSVELVLQRMLTAGFDLDTAARGRVSPHGSPWASVATWFWGNRSVSTHKGPRSGLSWLCLVRTLGEGVEDRLGLGRDAWLGGEVLVADHDGRGEAPQV